MGEVSLSELKALRKSLTRWREDMNDRAEELSDQLKALETKAGGGSSKPPKGDKAKGDESKDDEEDDNDDSLF